MKLAELNDSKCVMISVTTRARGSVDRASGSGPEERGFESLRAHKIEKQQTF